MGVQRSNHATNPPQRASEIYFTLLLHIANLFFAHTKKEAPPIANFTPAPVTMMRLEEEIDRSIDEHEQQHPA